VGADFQQLVHLLLVLGGDEADRSIFQDETHLIGDGILVEGHRNAAQALGGRHHHVQVGPVVADDGETLAAPEPQGGEGGGQGADPLGHRGPSPGLPDAQMLFAQGRRPPPHAGVAQQEPRKSRLSRRHVAGCRIHHGVSLRPLFGAPQKPGLPEGRWRHCSPCGGSGNRADETRQQSDDPRKMRRNRLFYKMNYFVDNLLSRPIVKP
jgi:hypothetical protein